MARRYVPMECWGCRSLLPAVAEGHRMSCGLHGWGLAAPHLSVCRDWWPVGLSEKYAPVLEGLSPGKLYEIHGSHEHFVEFTDLASVRRESVRFSGTVG